MRTGIAARFENVWSPEEEATLASSWAAGGIRAAMTALPGRTETAIYNKRGAMRLPLRRRQWTDEELRILRGQWGIESLHAISRLVKRHPKHIVDKAMELGLTLGAPDGWEFVTAAAERTGYCLGTLWPILRWAGVKIHRPYSKRKGHKRARHIVDPFEVDEAIARWCKTESITDAARRASEIAGESVSADVLERWLREAGTPVVRRELKRSHIRVPVEDTKRAVAARPALMATTETLEGASERVHLSIPTMRRYLERLGFVRTIKSQRVPRRLVDQIALGYWRSRAMVPSTRARRRRERGWDAPAREIVWKWPEPMKEAA